jgi:archaeal flagellin FlaB
MGVVMRKKDEAFSGLEAAIIVIALVVVATVFGMSVLSSGFYASEQAQKTTTSGYKLASSTVYIEGGVYASLLGGPGTALDKVWFSGGIPETGQAQDLRDMIIVYTHSVDSSIVRQYTYGGPGGETPTTFGVEGDPVMLPGEKRTFRLANVNGPIPGGWFTVEVKPKNGAATFVTYHLPDSFQGGSVLT